MLYKASSAPISSPWRIGGGKGKLLQRVGAVNNKGFTHGREEIKSLKSRMMVAPLPVGSAHDSYVAILLSAKQPGKAERDLHQHKNSTGLTMGQLVAAIAPLLPSPWLAYGRPVLFRRALAARRFSLVNFLQRIHKKTKKPSCPHANTPIAVDDLSFSVSLPWSCLPDSPSELKVRVPALQNVYETLEWLLQPVNGQAPPSLLGVDVETGHLRETQLLQLSTASRAVILRIPCLTQSSEAVATAGLDKLQHIMGDANLLKCGCELRKDALDLLYDTGLRVRMRGGRDVTPVLKRHGSGRVMGLVEAFNMRHGTTQTKDKKVTCSDWAAQQLSQRQWEYAALDAWMSFRLGKDKALLQSSETCHIDIPDGELNGALRDAGRLLRESQVVRDGCRIPIAHVFDEATWARKSGELKVRMAQYDNKMRRGDRVEVIFKGVDMPWFAYAITVKGKTALLQGDNHLGEHNAKSLSWTGAHPVVKDITRVMTNDYTGELLTGLIKDLVGQPPSAVPQTHSRFATKYLLGGTHAAAPPSFLPPFAPHHPAGAASFHLNDWQGSCVNDVVAGNTISLTLGPPGTGKTTCIAAVACSIAEHSRAESTSPLVVITTQQNVAALNVLRALMQGGYQSMKLVVGHGYYVEWHEHEYTEEERQYIHVPIFPDRGNQDNEDGRPPKPTPRLTEERAITIITLGYAASLAAGGSSDIVHGSRVGAVLVDEASQAWSAHALILDQAFPNMQRLHLFGDDKQLPPVLNPKDSSPAAKASNLAVRSMYDEARDGGKRHHSLQLQYRMPLRLADFLSTQLYGGTLNSAPDMSNNANDVLWLSVLSRHAYYDGSHSPCNEPEANLVVRLVNHIDQLRHLSWRRAKCLVLTPYSAQRHLVERHCQGASETRGGRWSIKTVDSFQGREADIVIISLTKTSSGLGFLEDLRRVNVMLSRARKRLIIVGNRPWFARSTVPLWRSLATDFPVANSFGQAMTMLGKKL